MNRALAAHPENEMLDLIERLLASRFPDLITDKDRTAAGAVGRCRAQQEDPYRLVIANHSLAADPKTPRNDAENKGLELLESIVALGHRDVLKILIAPVGLTNALLSRVAAVPNCHPVIQEPDTFEESFLTVVSKALEIAADESEEAAPRQEVVVNLKLDRDWGEYQFKGVGDFKYFTEPAPLHFNRSKLEQLIKLSALAKDQPQWEELLLIIGKQLGELLFTGDNAQFWGDLRAAQTSAGGTERKRICFNIGRPVHSAALEALLHPEEDRFWMLQVPMYRRLTRPAQDPLRRPVLFKERKRPPKPFTAFIIEAPAEGLVQGVKNEQGRDLELPPLKNVSAEADSVEKILRKVASSVERLGPKDVPQGRSFKDYLLERLKNGPWDLVHYAGHSLYQEVSGGDSDSPGKGFLFLPGTRYVEALDIELLNIYLAKAETRFLYLSGCQSSEAGFVFELARLQIPGVLGFRWPINDWAALEFAQTFYDNLFDERACPCLEKAFLATRCKLRDAHREDRIWAAGTLIVQDPD
jgi:hypothetical protein